MAGGSGMASAKSFGRVWAFLLAVLGIGGASASEVPPSLESEQSSLLRVDQFSPAKGRWSIQTGFRYRSVDRGGYIPSVGFLPTSDGRFIAVPSISPSADRIDTASASIGARYAVTSWLNLFGQVSGRATSARRTTSPGRSLSEGDAAFEALTLGADFRFTPGPSRTHVSGYASVAAIETEGDAFVYARSFAVGVTASTVVDPLILSATLGYSFFASRETSSGAVDPGEVLSFTPTIGFAVNPDINLSWGVGVSHRWADTGALSRFSESDVLTTVNLGLAYRLSPDRLLNVDARAGVGGNDAVELSMGVAQRF
jgi:hypothetical protein